MRKPRVVTVIVLLIVGIFVAPAGAQEAEKQRPPAHEYAYDYEVFGAVGWSRRGGDEGSRGDGPLLAAGFGLRPFSRLGFEIELGVLDHARRFSSGVHFEGTARWLSGSVLYHFSESKLQPFVGFGIGWMHSAQRARFEAAIRRPLGPEERAAEDSRFSDSFATWSAGVGLKAFLGHGLVVRPEVRYTGSGALGVLGMPRASIAFGYRW